MKDRRCKTCDEDDAKLNAMEKLSDKDKKKRHQQLESFKECILKDLQHIKPNDIWVEVSIINYCVHVRACTLI